MKMQVVGKLVFSLILTEEEGAKAMHAAGADAANAITRLEIFMVVDILL
jgi:hypothetical protein